MDIEYRIATMSDLPAIAAFADYWMAKIGRDYFVPRGQHLGYLQNYYVMLAICDGAIIGWSVKTNKGVLIHLLIAQPFRGKGIGSELLKRTAPSIVRSKFDQSTGDPGGFYARSGYVKVSDERLGKKGNIDIFSLPGVDATQYLLRQQKAKMPVQQSADSVKVTTEPKPQQLSSRSQHSFSLCFKRAMRAKR